MPSEPRVIVNYGPLQEPVFLHVKALNTAEPDLDSSKVKSGERRFRMLGDADFIDGWEIHSRPDGGYGIYDSHGLVAGPYGTKRDAIAAALQLPKHKPQKSNDRPGDARPHS